MKEQLEAKLEAIQAAFNSQSKVAQDAHDELKRLEGDYRTARALLDQELATMEAKAKEVVTEVKKNAKG